MTSAPTAADVNNVPDRPRSDYEALRFDRHRQAWRLTYTTPDGSSFDNFMNAGWSKTQAEDYWKGLCKKQGMQPEIRPKRGANDKEADNPTIEEADHSTPTPHGDAQAVPGEVFNYAQEQADIMQDIAPGVIGVSGTESTVSSEPVGTPRKESGPDSSAPVTISTDARELDDDEEEDELEEAYNAQWDVENHKFARLFAGRLKPIAPALVVQLVIRVGELTKQLSIDQAELAALLQQQDQEIEALEEQHSKAHITEGIHTDLQGQQRRARAALRAEHGAQRDAVLGRQRAAAADAAERHSAAVALS